MKKPKSKYSHAYKSLKTWLKINHHRFPARPYITKLKRNSFALKFEKVRNVEVRFFGSVFVEVLAWYGDKLKYEFVDYLEEFDLLEKENETKDEAENLGNGQQYDDIDSIYITEIFEPLLAWTLKNITPENYLFVYQLEDQGSMRIKIIRASELDKQKNPELLISCKPIISKEK